MPVVDYGEAGPMRCSRCRAYVNPFFTFVNRGRTFVCNLCGAGTPTPREHICELDADGYRVDTLERPELCKGVVEFAAPAEYCARPPQPPALVFLVEATHGAVSNAIFDTVTPLSRENPHLPATWTPRLPSGGSHRLPRGRPFGAACPPLRLSARALLLRHR